MKPMNRFVQSFISLVLFAAVAASSQHAFAKTKVRASDETAKEAAEQEDQSENRPTTTKQKSHSYYGSNNFMNVRVSPLGLLISYINFDIDFKVSSDWTVGPTITYWNYGFESSLYTNRRLDVQTLALGVRGTWAQNGAFQTGLYVSPVVQFVKATASGTSAFNGSRISAEGNPVIATGLVGYQWYGDNFNINVGAGLSVGASSSKIEVNDGTTTTSVESTRTGSLAIDFMIGYAF